MEHGFRVTCRVVRSQLYWQRETMIGLCFYAVTVRARTPGLSWSR
jgi:hypothetical protein